MLSDHSDSICNAIKVVLTLVITLCITNTGWSQTLIQKYQDLILLLDNQVTAKSNHIDQFQYLPGHNNYLIYLKSKSGEIKLEDSQRLRTLEDNFHIVRISSNKEYDYIRPFCLAVLPANSLWKTSPRLLEKMAAQPEGAYRLEYVLQYTDREKFFDWFLSMKFSWTVLDEFKASNLVSIRLSDPKHLDKLLESDAIQFIDIIKAKPKEELLISRSDPGANGLNRLDMEMTLLNGRGIHISIKENRYDTTDIDFSNRHVVSKNVSEERSGHASIMATIAAGAGNTSPTSRGIAWGTQLSSSDFKTLLPDEVEDYNQLNISVQNHSYGIEGTENFYGLDAMAYDQSAHQVSNLVHVFSAGNQGKRINDGGPYDSIDGYASLSGSFKMAKNALVVGSMDAFGNVPVESSRGPAYDGRIKPEVVAIGESGSSGAAAFVSGAAASIQQQYQELNNGGLPSSALVKAVFISGAEDIEAPGPDFISGFGKVNVYHNYEILANNRYLTSSIDSDETKVHEIVVPDNASNLRIAICWTDHAAEAFQLKALVNDLDLLLVTPDSLTFQPWTLNGSPNTDSLTSLAKRGKDSLNNIELVTLERPIGGTYKLIVSSNVRIDSMQQYSIAFNYKVPETFEWTYPSEGNHLISGFEEILRWKSTLSNSIGILEYSTDDGQIWNLISDEVQLDDDLFVWTPQEELRMANFRIRVDSMVFPSPSCILYTPLELEIGLNCQDSVLLYWNRRDEAQSYEIYTLGDQYMEHLTTVNDTFVVLGRNDLPSPYLAVGPYMNEYGYVDRGITKNIQTQGVGCYFDQFFATLRGQKVQLEVELGTLYNVHKVVFEKIVDGQVVVVEEFFPKAETSLGSEDVTIIPGINRYRVRIDLFNGDSVFSNLKEVYFSGDSAYLIFPNPLKSEQPLSVISRDSSEPTFFLYSPLGQVILSFDLNDFLVSSFFSNIPPGMYFYSIYGDQGEEQNGRLIIVR